MKASWRWCAIVSLISLATASTEAAAQADVYPNKPVRFISDSAPGSSPDVGLRIVAEALSQHWGQQVVVVNHPGASGAISARVAAEAAPDGYTLYAPALSTFLTLPGRATNLPLMLPRDFVPIGFTFDQPMSIGASHTLGVNTLPELIALAKNKPGEITYSVAGVGRMTHLTGELLQMRTDINMVPYTAMGCSPAPTEPRTLPRSRAARCAVSPKTTRHARSNDRPTSRTVAAMPVLRRPHDHHRDLRVRRRAEAPAHTTFGGDQGRHLMMPSPPINDSYDTGNSRWLSASSAQVCVDPLDCPGRNTNLVVLPADRSFTPTCSHWLCRKPIAATDPVQPHQPKTRG